MLNLEPSRCTAVAIVALHLLSIAAIAIADIALWIKLTAAPLVLASLLFNHRANRLRETLIWHKGDHWHLQRGADRLRRATLSHIDFLSRWLVIITLTHSEKRGWMRHRKIVIPADALDADTFHLLRVRLKIEAIPMLQAPAETPFQAP